MAIRFENIAQFREYQKTIYDYINQELIQLPLFFDNQPKLNNTTRDSNVMFQGGIAQKTIRDGLISIGRNDVEKLLLYQKDVEANVEDNLQAIADMIVEAFEVSVQQGADDTVSVSIVGGGFQDGGMDITQYIVGEGNP